MISLITSAVFDGASFVPARIIFDGSHHFWWIPSFLMVPHHASILLMAASASSAICHFVPCLCLDQFWSGLTTDFVTVDRDNPTLLHLHSTGLYEIFAKSTAFSFVKKIFHSCFNNRWVVFLLLSYFRGFWTNIMLCFRKFSLTPARCSRVFGNALSWALSTFFGKFIFPLSRSY